jgi:pyruvate formate lyase activating enzyme
MTTVANQTIPSAKEAPLNVKNEDIKGSIFDIQHYSIHDGPGIRTTVFFKGCPLRCLWCQNPESQSLHPQLFFSSDTCAGCGKCVAVCPEKAITIHEEKSQTDRNLCKACGKCVDVCPNEARGIMGKYATVKEVFDDVMKDDIFYRRSGGGVTLSGGEPFFQPRFAVALLKMLKNAGIHTAVETCGQAPWNVIKEALSYVDLVLYDFKHMESSDHKKSTGLPNDLIIKNAKKIVHEATVPLSARIPIIPGCNDSVSNMEATALFIAKELDVSVPVHLLAYHRMGESKWTQMEEKHTPLEIEPPDEAHMQILQKIFENQGLKVIIGG